MTFTSVLKTIGLGFSKGLGWAVTYGVPVEKLVALLFPQTAPVADAVIVATTLIRNTILLVEQKYAASGVQHGTGAQKLEEVLLLAGPAAASLLGLQGDATDAEYLKNLVNVVVDLQNLQNFTEHDLATK